MKPVSEDFLFVSPAGTELVIGAVLMVAAISALVMWWQTRSALQRRQYRSPGAHIGLGPNGR